MSRQTVVLGRVADFEPLVGQPPAFGEWLLVDQEKIDAFATLTDDHQWLHVDVERAKASPYGGTIAHGLLTLAIVPTQFNNAFSFPDRRFSLNYGFDKVRFTSPVPSGTRVRAGFALASVETIKPDVIRCHFTVTIEVEGAERPALVATWLLQMGY